MVVYGIFVRIASFFLLNLKKTLINTYLYLQHSRNSYWFSLTISIDNDNRPLRSSGVAAIDMGEIHRILPLHFVPSHDYNR